MSVECECVYIEIFKKLFGYKVDTFILCFSVEFLEH